MRKLYITSLRLDTMDGDYLKRVVDKYIDDRLQSVGAILIEGAKWCGKTRTAKEHAVSTLFMQNPKNTKNYLMMADTDPSILLEGDTPRLIDEWQMAPALWDAVRFEVDERSKPGQFILTGSSVPRDDEIMHSGTGRISRVLMRPMSLFESMDSNGSVSLNDMFNGKKMGARSDLSVKDIASLIARGGWPGSIGMDDAVAIRNVQDYVESIVNTDVSRVDGTARDPAAVRNLLKSLSRNISSTASIPTIVKDMAGDDTTISEKTASSYISALRRIFIVEDLPAWNPSIRSKTAIRSSPKRHFVDPSIAIASLRATPKGLLNDFNTFGLLFESLCVRDLRVYSQSIDGNVFHYRDKNDLEADAVVHLNDGRWGAIEVKMGNKEIEDAAANLLKLKEKVDTGRMNEPSFLMIITAGEYAYTRDDGVSIVPIGCLRD